MATFRSKESPDSGIKVKFTKGKHQLGVTKGEVYTSTEKILGENNK